MNWEGFCGNCKFYEQGNTCSFCGNPEQKDENLKNYSYYSFGCPLYEKGVAQSRLSWIEKTRLDWIEKNKTPQTL